MSAKLDLINYMFEGNADPLSNILVQDGDGTSPNGVTTAPKGTFLLINYPGDATDKDVYINTDGSSAWTIINNETA